MHIWDVSVKWKRFCGWRYAFAKKVIICSSEILMSAGIVDIWFSVFLFIKANATLCLYRHNRKLKFLHVCYFDFKSLQFDSVSYSFSGNTVILWAKSTSISRQVPFLKSFKTVSGIFASSFLFVRIGIFQRIATISFWHHFVWCSYNVSGTSIL